MFAEDVEMDGRNILRLLEKHEMFRILNGHPQSIALAAALMQSQKLHEIYENLKNNLHNALRADESFLQEQENPLFSLTASLNTSYLLLVKRFGEPSIQFFSLFGLLPGGADKHLLKSLWKGEVNNLLNLLESNSLIVLKEVEQTYTDSVWYQTFPVISLFAKNLI